MGEDDRGKTKEQLVEELQALRARTDALRGRLALLEAVVEVTNDAAFVKDTQGRYLMINTEGARLLSESVGEVVGKDDTEVFPPDSARPIIACDRNILDEGTTRTFEAVATSAGVTRSYLVTKGPYRDDQGRVVGVIGIARDISEGKRLQAERDGLLRRLRIQIDRLPLGYVLMDADGRVLDWNPAAEELFGYTKEEALGRACLDLIIPPPVDDQVQEVVHRVWSGDTNAQSVNENRTKDGRILTCQWFNTPLKEADGRFAGAISLAWDVTERIRTEKSLEEGRRRFLAVFENSLDSILLMDDTGRFVDANPAACQLLGYSREDLLRSTVRDVTPVQDRGRIPELLGRFLSEGTLSGEFTLVCKGGATREVEYRSVANVLPGLHLGVHRDITQRKRAEEALRGSEERLRLAADLVGLSSDEWDLSTPWVPVWDARLKQMWGLPPDAPVDHETVMAAIHPDDRPTVEAAIARALNPAGDGGYAAEYRVIGIQDGVERWVSARGRAIFADGRPVRVIGAVREITDRKRAEETLARQARLLDVTHDAIIVRDMDGTIIFWNHGAEVRYGWTREEALGRSSRTLLRTRFPEPLEEVDAELLREGQWEGELVHTRRDGGLIMVASRWVLQRDERGRPLSVLETNNDDTARRRAEEALRESEEQIRLLLDSTAEAVYGIDLDGRCTFCNAACLRLLGYIDSRDLLGKTMHRRIHHSRADGTPYPLEECRIYQAFRRGEEEHVEDEVLWRADGTSFPAEYWSYPVRRGDEVVGAVVTFVDITERRRAEEEVRTLNAALENA
jgi:PAS domain S-box-containing protein